MRKVNEQNVYQTLLISSFQELKKKKSEKKRHCLLLKTDLFGSSTGMSLGNAVCRRCGDGFGMQEQIINSNGEVWHTYCFV